MHPPRLLAAVTVAALLLCTTASGQRFAELVCRGFGDDYIACAVHAGQIPDLRDARYAANEREIRFWTVSGMFAPDQLLLIHQHGDTVTGKLLLIWPDSSVTSPLATSVCNGQSWVTPAGSMCTGRLAAPQDWARTVQQVDALGLSQLPGNPVPEERCNRTPIPPRPGELPRDRICRTIADGFTNSIEMRTSTVYWRYEFPPLPDITATAVKRDKAILGVLSCAVRKLGDGPC